MFLVLDGQIVMSNDRVDPRSHCVTLPRGLFWTSSTTQDRALHTVSISQPPDLNDSRLPPPPCAIYLPYNINTLFTYKFFSASEWTFWRACSIQAHTYIFLFSDMMYWYFYYSFHWVFSKTWTCDHFLSDDRKVFSWRLPSLLDLQVYCFHT